MRSQPFGMCIGLLFLLTCCLLFSTPALMAQSAPSGPEVISAKQHDVSPPLRDIPPVPESKSKREMHRHDMNTLPLAPTPPQTDPVLQTSAGPLVATTSGLSFAGVGQGDYGYVVKVAPPDTNGAVGATQFLQWVNTSFAVFDKTTGALLYGPAAGNTFWSGFGDPCQSSNSGDPIAQYDKAAGRWVVTQPVFTSPYKVCVAVSTSSDTTGSYNRYVFPMSSYFPDYPKLAVWSDAYYMSFNFPPRLSSTRLPRIRHSGSGLNSSLVFARDPEKYQAIMKPVESRPAGLAEVLRSFNDEDYHQALNATDALNTYDPQVVQVMRDLAADFEQQIRKYNSMSPLEPGSEEFAYRIQHRFNHWCTVWQQMHGKIHSHGREPVEAILKVALVHTESRSMQAVVDCACHLLDVLQ